MYRILKVKFLFIDLLISWFGKLLKLIWFVKCNCCLFVFFNRMILVSYRNSINLRDENLKNCYLLMFCSN